MDYLNTFKKLILLSSLAFSYSSHAQFWTENFNNGCTAACTAVGYTSTNGTWTQTILGPEGTGPNAWYVSCAEQNNGIGLCSSTCPGPGGNASLHISEAIGSLMCANDCGAWYDGGGLCGFLPFVTTCPETNRRIESPVINCTGQSNITMNYAYIHNAVGASSGLPGPDFASIWYFNGTTWSNLGAVPHSPDDSTCVITTDFKIWAAGSIALPASANNNPNVKIGFSWRNGLGGIPLERAVAIDDITLSTPPAVVSLTLPSPVCRTSTLSATYTSTTGLTTFTWSASSPNIVFSPVNSGTTTLSFTGSGIYTVSVTACQGTNCATGTSTIQVVPTPTVNITASPSSICSPGSSSTLTATGGPGPSSYTWTASSGQAIPSGSVAVVSPAATTSYTALTSASGCTANAVVTVSVLSPTLTLTPNLAICSGQSASLSASGAVTYTWNPAGSLSSANGAVVTASPLVTTSYTVTGSSGACTNSAVVTVSVNPTATISVTSSGNSICPGQSVTLTASGASTYTWLPGGNTTSSINASPATTTTYTVTGQTAGGCAAFPATITVSVLPSINPVITASSPTVCLSQTVTLSASPTGAGVTYAWTPAAQIQGSTTLASVIARPTSTATVIYTVNVSSGSCSATATVAIQPLACMAPSATIQTISNDSICTGGCVTFTAATSGVQPITYLWAFPGGTPPTSNLPNPQVCYLTKGNYSVALAVTNAFGSSTVTANNFIHVADTPAVFNAIGDTTLKIGQTTIIKAIGAGLTYYWYPDVNGSIACPSCANTVVQPTVSTTYYVEVSNSPYCKRRDSVLVKVDFNCGDFFVPNAFSPNGDGLNDMINVHGFCIGTYTLQIFSRWGEKVFETSSLTQSWDGTFRGQNMDAGVFVYRADGITIEGKPFSIKGNITLIR